MCFFVNLVLNNRVNVVSYRLAMDSKTDESVENESKETIEQILRYFECDDSILVKMMQCMAGSQDGDNYMSVVKRLIVSGTHNKNQNENGK